MYEEHGDFDQSCSSVHGGGLSQSDVTFSQTHPPGFDQANAAALEMELQHQLDLQQCYGGGKSGGGDWEEMSGFNPNSAAHFNQILDAGFTAPNHLLQGIFPQLPRCSPPSLLPNGGGMVYDPLLLPLNLPPQPQPPLLKDLFHSLPNSGGFFGGARNMDERDMGLQYQNDGVFEFAAAGNGRDHENNNKDTKHFATERHRRVLLNDKYKALRSLIPSPTKQDRASVVGDAIGYIKELKRTVGELQVLLEKKRFGREKLKRPKMEEIIDPTYNGASSLRSSWLHRKSKNTEVDVRIIDDEITVKLVQQKRINCLLFVSKVLDELQLDLHHVAGGVVGDYYSYLFNSKICEGSIVYASAVANKLIDAVDKQYAAVPQVSSSY